MDTNPKGALYIYLALHGSEADHSSVAPDGSGAGAGRTKAGVEYERERERERERREEELETKGTCAGKGGG